MRAMLAGLALILGTNAIAIGGALYNRSAADSTLVLTQRELRQSWQSGREEDSGLSLHLQARTLGAAERPGEAYDIFGYWGGAPGWLDGEKLLALGFEAPATPVMGRGDFFRAKNRKAFLVLELEGASWREAVRRTEAALARIQADADKDPASKERAERLKGGKESLAAEQDRRSRLFIVDAGMDAEALRAQYPDRAHFAIVAGHVSAYACGEDKHHLCGSLEMDVPELNVPQPMRAAMEGASAEYDYGIARPGAGAVASFRATVAFGRRFEPWIASAERVTPGP